MGRENVMVKIPATTEGLPAITRVLAEGISVNVTLIFSLTRYREVINAWLAGLEGARTNGHDLSKLHSVASFFVSRVDTEIDNQLEAAELPDNQVQQLRGRAGIANARLAYRIFEQAQETERWQLLAASNARLQRPRGLPQARRTQSIPMCATSMVSWLSIRSIPCQKPRSMPWLITGDHRYPHPGILRNGRRRPRCDSACRSGLQQVVKLEVEGLENR